MDEKRHCVEYFDGTLTHGKISVGKNILWSTVGTSKMRRMIFKRIVCSLNVENIPEYCVIFCESCRILLWM